MKINSRSGFTLIELVVVIAVIAIIASIALPKYTNFVERQKMSTDIIALKQLKEMSENYKDLNGNYPSMPSDTHTSAEEMKSFVDAFYGPLGIMVKADYYTLSSTIKGSFGSDASGAARFQADLGGVYITAGEVKSESYFFFIDENGEVSIASSSSDAYKTSGSTDNPLKVEN